MACNSCAKPFTLLRREKGCPGCGFSYCSKCLEYKIFVKKINAEAKVCVKCKTTAASKSDEGSKIQPPDAYFKRIGAYIEPHAANAVPALSTGNETDQQILERLQKLKEKTNPNISGNTDEEIADRLRKIRNIPTTSNAEIQERLARLKGIPNISGTSTKPLLPAPDLRSEQEQADDLMRQYVEQTQIDTQYKDKFECAVTGIEARLVRLKGADGKPAGPAEADDHSEDEEELVEKIISKYKAQGALEGPEDEVAPSTDDELPFCEICDEDATLRCLGCRYLFCRRCYLEHKDDDDGCNRYEPYKPKSR